MQVHENEEYQAVSLSKEAKSDLYFLHTIYTNVQHKNFNMSWDYRKFTCQPVAAESFEMRGSNNLISYYCYGLYPKFGKFFVTFYGFHVYLHTFFINLIDIGYQIVLRNINQGMPVLKIITTTK